MVSPASGPAEIGAEGMKGGGEGAGATLFDLIFNTSPSFYRSEHKALVAAVDT